MFQIFLREKNPNVQVFKTEVNWQYLQKFSDIADDSNLCFLRMDLISIPPPFFFSFCFSFSAQIYSAFLFSL